MAEKFGSVADQATISDTARAAELSGTRSHFHSPSPRILPQHIPDVHDSPTLAPNVLLSGRSPQLEHHVTPHGQTSLENNCDPVAASTTQEAPGRPHDDSLFSLSAFSGDSDPSSCGSLSLECGASVDLGDAGNVTWSTKRPTARPASPEARLSFSSNSSIRPQTEPNDGVTEHFGLTQYDDLESDSTLYDSEIFSDEEESEISRPYIGSRKFSSLIELGLSRGNSAVADGSERDHPKQRQQFESTTETVQTVSHSAAQSSHSSLRRQLYRGIVSVREDKFFEPGYGFFPRSLLGDVINAKTVFAELERSLSKNHTKAQIETYANTVCSVTRELIRVEKSASIPAFIDEDVNDLDLPLVPVYEDGCVIGMHRRNSVLSERSKSLLRCFNGEEWSPKSLRNFDQYQWTMLAPFFSQGKDGEIKHYTLHDQHILPFVHSDQVEDDATEYAGGYGKVMMVHIHQAHHNFFRKTPYDCGFVIKQFYDSNSIFFKRERESLQNFSGINSHDHIVSLLATYEHRNKYHFIFHRAKGSLRDCWEKFEQSPALSHGNMLWMSRQCLGIADGLSKIHGPSTFRTRRLKKKKEPEEKTIGISSVRYVNSVAKVPSNMTSEVVEFHPKFLACALGHSVSPDRATSDLQEVRYGIHCAIDPSNILWFEDDLLSSSIGLGILQGTLQIADFVAAEFNSVLSKIEPGVMTNTVTYRPPESDAVEETIRQSYDIWGLGCVYLEFVVWTLGGSRLRDFAFVRMSRDSTLADMYTDTYFELVCNPETREMEARIKQSVIDFVETLHHRSDCTVFFHDLLNLILHKMLLVDPNERISCKDVYKALGKMHEECERAEYAMPLRLWKFDVDNNFAEKVITHAGARDLSLHTTATSNLCGRCSNLEFWSPGFIIKTNVSELSKRAKSCDFCNLLLEVCSVSGLSQGEAAWFERSQSNIIMTGSSFPILSIIQYPELETQSAIQIGFPELLPSSSDAFFSLAKQWLKDCDENHACLGSVRHKLPTRLIDVGTVENSYLRLVETHEESVHDPHYIALSHPWGDTSTYKPFVTLRKDYSGAGHDIVRFKTSIPYEGLPATFKDAVDCTRKLNVRYLWIDSICIIQGRDGDFADEAKKMEDVYSGAYCVVAASRASSQQDGFLGPKPQRRYVIFQRKKPFYVSQTIDRFDEDVIQGSLNQRGWVLQERALARRTIYFTEHQTYFECGNGVRCETLTKMHNKMADFLGDPNFPEKVMRTKSHMLKIEYFQGLFKQYSRLGFTCWEDRPVAIAGLEQRLQRAFETHGRYGIFDDGDNLDGRLFHCSLLWRREWLEEEEKDGEPLEAITFPPQRNMNVPSWSWMAYKGAIDYIDPPYQTADWETEVIVPLWTMAQTQNLSSHEDVALAATARDFTLADQKRNEAKVAFDTARGAEGQRVQCVIVAIGRGRSSSHLDRRHYVLLVIPTQTKTKEGETKYKRVGAGFMMGKFIDFDKPGVDIRIY